MSSLMLSSDLSTLISDTKRKKPEIRKAAEASLSSLNNHKNLSNLELGNALSQDREFASPFLLACSSTEPKLVRPGINGILQLLSLRGIDASLLTKTLDLFESNVSLGQEIHLRILQCLQKLDENYGPHIRGPLVIKCLNLCTTLQSKGDGTVSHISVATFQQIIVSLFEAINLTTSSISSDEAADTASVDGYNVLKDLCYSLTDIQRTNRLSTRASPSQALELIDIILRNNASLFEKIKQFLDLIEQSVLPFLIEHLSEYKDFKRICRILRLTKHILHHYTDDFPDQCGAAIYELSRQTILEETPFWKRAALLETFVDLHTSSNLVRRVVDAQAQPRQKEESLLGYHLSVLERVAKATPENLKWNNTTQPSGSDTEISEASISRPIDSSLLFYPHNMIESSSRTRFVDNLDRKDPIELPKYYLHHLVLLSINGLALDLDRVIAQASFPQEDVSATPATKKKKKGKVVREREFVDPMLQKANPLFQQISSYHKILEHHGESLLQICNVFLFTVQDEDSYLDFAASIRRICVALQILKMDSQVMRALELLHDACLPRTPVDWAREKLSPLDGEAFVSELGHHRLVCLKTSLEIAISVGFLMKGNAWQSVWDSLAYSPDFDYLGFQPETGSDEQVALLLESGIERLLSTTVTTSLTALDQTIQGFVGSLRIGTNDKTNSYESKTSRTLNWLFDLLQRNSIRLAKDVESCELLSEPFNATLSIMQKSESDALRTRTAKYLNSTALSIAKETQDNLEVQTLAFQLFFSIVKQQIDFSSQGPSGSTAELHYIAFDALISFLQTLGEKITDWPTVLDLISTVFLDLDSKSSSNLAEIDNFFSLSATPPAKTKSIRLVQISFSIFRLVCADFREVVLNLALPKCIRLLRGFASQQTDLNISLEALSTFWAFGSDLISKSAPFLDELSIGSQSSRDPTIQYEGENEEAANSIILKWTYTIDALICVSVDPRPNVRDTATQMLVKILGMRKGLTDALSFDAIFRLLKLNLCPTRQVERQIAVRRETQSAWFNSTALILDQTATLIRPPKEASNQIETFQSRIMILLDYLAMFAETRRSEIVSATMLALNRLLTNNFSDETPDKDILRRAWNIWYESALDWSVKQNAELVQPFEAQLSWAQCFRCFRSKTIFTSLEAAKSLQLFERGLRMDLLPTSAKDIESMTSFQVEAIEAVKSLDPSDPVGLMSIIHFSTAYSNLGLQSLTKQNTEVSTRSTYFALTKSSLEILQHTIDAHSNSWALYAHKDLLFNTFEMLAYLIQTKNERTSGGARGSPVWKVATQVAPKITCSILDAIKTMAVPLSTNGQVFRGLVMVLRAIASPGRTTEDIDENFQDEADDIHILELLHPLFTSVLRNSDEDTDICNSYAVALFEESKMRFLEPLKKHETTSPLTDLPENSRYGQTYDISLRTRTEIPFICLKLLVDLSLQTESQTSREPSFRLARQLLLARAVETLNSFILDQPLRGLRPTPKSHQRELITLVDALLVVHSATMTRPGLAQIWNEESSCLLPLIAQAVTVSRLDPKLLKVLSKAGLVLGKSPPTSPKKPDSIASSKLDRSGNKPTELRSGSENGLKGMSSKAVQQVEQFGKYVDTSNISERELLFYERMRGLQYKRWQIESHRAKVSPLSENRLEL